MRIIKYGISNKGIGIIAAIFIILIVSAMGVTVVSLLGTDTTSSLNYMHSQQAFFIAEGGLQYYLEQLSNQAGSWTTPPVKPANEALGAGNFTITTENEADDAIDVISTAQVSGADQKIIIRVIRAHAERSEHEAFSYFAYIDGNVNCNSATGTVESGNLCTGGSMQNWDPGELVINDGPPIESHDTSIPTVNFTYYQSIADSTSTSSFTSSASPYSGVYYYNGNVEIEDDVLINGTIVATGKITFTRADNITVSPSSNYPALVTGNQIAASRATNIDIDGVIYSEGAVDISRTSGCRFDGVIISGGTLSMQNSANEIGAYNFTEAPPGFSGGNLTLSSWNETY